MRVHSELQNVRIADGPGRTVEGIVRVREVDARVHGRGFVYQRQQPIGVVVHTRSEVQRVALPRNGAFASAAAALAGPVLFLATKRFFRKGRRR